MEPRRTRLASGATVLTESMSAVESVAFGLYFPTGSRHETAENNGISHFIEHLLFKGTSKRSADEINREIDLMGGASNAYTSKETVCFHARVLGRDLPRVVEFFGDMASGALPDRVGPELEREREVILAEISAVEDSPEDLVGDLSDLALFADHPLALPVVGSARAVAGLGFDQIRRHFRTHLVTRGLVVAAAGKLDHDQLVALAEEHLDGVPRGGEPPELAPAAPLADTRVAQRDLEQVHLCLSARGVARSDARRAESDLLSAIIGEGYSSRLFREVRDRRGLAYSVYSAFASYLETGSFNVYAAVSPDKLDEALEVISNVLAGVRDGGIDAGELDAAKQHLYGSTVLGNEFPSARMGHLAEKGLLDEENLDIEEELGRLQQASLSGVSALANELLSERLALAVVGPVDPKQFPSGGWELP